MNHQKIHRAQKVSTRIGGADSQQWLLMRSDGRYPGMVAYTE